MKKILFLLPFLFLIGCSNPIEPNYHKGTMVYQNLEGGFWSIMPEAVVPYELDNKFKVEGLGVEYEYKGMAKTKSAIQWGKQVRLTFIRTIK